MPFKYFLKTFHLHGEIMIICWSHDLNQNEKKCSAEEEGYEMEMHKMRQVFTDVLATVSPVKAVESFSHSLKNNAS